MMNEDMSLVRAYAEHRSEPAFETLVERYAGLVHSSALRQTGDAHLAEEITQTVFIILARKAASLGEGTVLASWLYRATLFAAAKARYVTRRRQLREQEAFMQSTVNDDVNESVWQQLAPVLDDAMSRLGEADRTALVLRYFENKSAAEIATALRINEAAAQKRVRRALEKLRLLFAKRGVKFSAANIADSVATHSVQAVPAAMTKTISAVALTKGAATSTSTLTLIKGTLKLMAWTKAKTAIITGVVVLFLAPPVAMITVKEYQEHRTPPWQEAFIRGKDNFVTLSELPQVYCMIAPSKVTDSEFLANANGKVGGLGWYAKEVIPLAYDVSPGHVIFSDQLHFPTNRFDFISNLGGYEANMLALQKEAEKKFGIIGKKETRPTDVMVLRVKTPNVAGLKVSKNEGVNWQNPRRGKIQYGNQSMEELAQHFELNSDFPVEDETGMTNRYNFELATTMEDLKTRNWEKINTALDTIGLELVPTNMPIEVLVVEKAK